MRILFASLWFVGCVPLEAPDDFEPFTYRTVRDTDFALVVRDERDEPVPGAFVQLRSADGDVAFRGVTDERGRLAATLAVPAHTSELELLIQRRGYEGAHDDEARRRAWGPFAPSSVTQVHRTELGDLTSTLVRGEDR
jgi:hypothetical protein